MKITYKGTSLRKYIFDHGGDASMYAKVHAAIQRRKDDVSSEDVIAHYLEGKRIRRKVRDKLTYNTSGLGERKFKRKYEYRGEPLWKVLSGNDYFSCIRYIKRHPEIPSDEIMERFIGGRRDEVCGMFRKDSKYGFDRMELDGKPVKEIMNREQYTKFCGHMRRNRGADHEKVARLILSGAKHVTSRRMWKGVPLITVMNGCRNDVMRVTHYCTYHGCSVDDAMERMSEKFGWTFDKNGIRKFR